MGVGIRDETPADAASVHRVVRDAFGGSAEADLVAALRGSTMPHVSLVAEHAGSVRGHVFFSPVRVEGETAGACFGALAPLAVSPASQRRGIGAALVEAGLRRCRALGWKAVFVLGDPAYYGRFGFALAAPWGLHYESEVFDRAFQVLSLEAEALDGERGFVRYPEAFAELG